MGTLSKKTRLLLLLSRRMKKDKYKKSFWIRKLYQERKTKGEFYLLVQDLRLFDDELFFRYFRMNASKFEELLLMVAPKIKKNCVSRDCIGPTEMLCVTMRYLATGDCQTTIAMNYRMSPTTVGRIIFKTCRALWIVLAKFIKPPTTESEWIKLAEEFEIKWNFPHCLGALDGKHVVMQAPANSGSMFFNYKKNHSIVLMAICNANYEFTLVDIGDAGRNSDGGIFSYSKIGEAVKNNSLNFPCEKSLPGFQEECPYVMVADEAFQLQHHIMKPYPREVLGIAERVFNYRLSRARRTIENAFGILAARFRIFRRAIHARVEMVVRITQAAVVLHNYLMREGACSHGESYFRMELIDKNTKHGTQPGRWREITQGDKGLQSINRDGSNNYSRNAKKVREAFKNYFMSNEGQVIWQWESVHATENCFDKNN